QPRLNDLLRGRIDKFSLDALVNIASRADLRVDLHVRKAA
ncbi:MAG: XRE family transcriptional regulator, partial [Gammaproteobacteria bacterium]